MPCTNTGDLAETLVSFSWELLCVPSWGDTVVTATLGDTNAINHFVLGEDGVDGNFLFEVILAPFDLVSDGTTIDLDFNEMGLLLTEGKALHLGMADGTDRNGVLLQQFQITIDGLLLAGIPVLVESSLDFISKTGSPNGLDGSWTIGGLDVTGDTDNLEWWAFNDGDWFDDFLLVDCRTWFFSFTDDMSHTGLETNEGGQMDWLGSIILWE